MANLIFNDIFISGVAACVPKKVVRNETLTDLIPPAEMEKTLNNIGIFERREAAPEMCASDLCHAAAERLLQATGVDRDSIDVLIFMSQSGDHPIPATAPSLQARLCLGAGCAAFDISLGCSGYVYALATAFAYAAQPSIRRVLLLDGETFTKMVSPKDKVNAPLYGDAGTATLIEKGGGGTAHFSLFSDGSGASKIMIKAGACRVPSTPETLRPREQEESNVRSDNQLYMDGMEVFNFTMRVVPKSVLELLKFADLELTDLDHLVFHQANKFMTDFFAKKLKCPMEKVPYSLHRFGNTSSASIPLTIATALQNSLKQPRKVLLSAFGAGLSWGGAVLDMPGCVVPNLVEL